MLQYFPPLSYQLEISRKKNVYKDLTHQRYKTLQTLPTKAVRLKIPTKAQI